MAIDVEKAGIVIQAIDNMRIPYLVEQRAWPEVGHFGPSLTG
jgi:hypothetical protein